MSVSYAPAPKVSKEQRDLMEAQAQLAAQQKEESEEDRNRRIGLQQPLIDRETALASGDATAVLKASAPTIAKLSEGFQGAKDRIYDSVPAGPARDYALSQLERDKAGNISTFMANEVNQAPQILSDIGSGAGAFSLQELGAALSGYGAASQTGAEISQMENQRKASAMQMWSSLANQGGKAASQYFSGGSGGWGS